VAGFFLVVLVLSPLLIEPLFNTYRPAPAGPVRETVEALARANGVPADKILIYDGSRQSNRYTANVTGLFGTARIALSDTMLRKDADIAEVRAVVGHEMGHYVRGDAFEMAAFFGLVAAVGLFLADRLFRPVARLVAARNLEGIADPAGYPVLAMILAVLGLAATPILNTYNRIGEADADRFSLERANEPDGMARALLKTVEYRAATPSRLEEAMFYGHPSVGSRIRMAMDWKAAHGPAR
jgi:STE24 endopeptidase